MRDRELLPVRGTWVKSKDGTRRGIVKDIRPDEDKVRVKWRDTVSEEWVDPYLLRCGFELGMDVQDVPLSRVRKSLGEGVVLETRTLGGREQVLVEFPANGQRVWLPYQNLRQILGTRHRFLLPKPVESGQAERLRLRNLAHALELWNENTGSLSHLDIDPLPHQIHLVHHILASGNLNWLIADDVGLGKTIELGMLLAALRQRQMLRRVLIVTPAGLTRQWQEELRYKFELDQFRIYGLDFEINDHRHWKLYDFVIGSIDRLKMEEHKAKLLAAGTWDLIVFDEAHRLSRRQYGMKIDASDRFKLAADLRPLSEAFILLSATPHQGMQDKFQALLELLRPEWTKEIRRLALHPELLKDMVIRNYKADVTDAQGNFIFKGKTTHKIPVPLSDESIAFDRLLQDYLRRGYAAGRSKGREGIAIGFVMTIYRKLAASSAAAIHMALLRRLARLRDEYHQTIEISSMEDRDDRYQGEWEEVFEVSEKEFFIGEIQLLEDLIAKAGALLEADLKMKAVIDELLTSVLSANPEEKVLIFTEYRATQDYIHNTLNARFGTNTVEMIHGGQSQDERRAAIARFEDSGQFLISTEAGGEGINLQRRCHIMVNFDLPWNPMRLVQRIGRLYRYGQQKRVVVFNVHAPQTIDAQIMDLMYARIIQVVNDMAVLGHEFNENLADDILGELADLLEVEEILEDATQAGIERTQERIEEALARAKAAVGKQRELFEHVAHYDPNEIRHEIYLTVGHLQAFMEGMFAQAEINVLNRMHQDKVWEIRLPSDLEGIVPGFRSRLQVTLDRVWAANRPGIHMLDLDSPLVKRLLIMAKSHEFGGKVASLTGLSGTALLTAILRWQNDQGRRMRQEFAALLIHPDGRVDSNPRSVSDWLLQSATNGHALPDKAATKILMDAAEVANNRRLAQVSNRDLHPENRQWISGGWL